MQFVVGIDIGCSDKLRYISACLARQIVVDIPETLGILACTSNSAVYISWTAVISGDSK